MIIKMPSLWKYNRVTDKEYRENAIHKSYSLPCEQHQHETLEVSR